MKKGRTSALRKLLLGALAVSSVGLMAGTANAAGIAVYVGYVDNLRASGFFPSVWLTSPGVVSQTPDGQSLDAGAIRIDNNTGGSITISNFDVYFPNVAAHFTLWSSLTIGNGNTGIFTQTGSYNFDTSDFGIFGGLPPSSLAPGGANGLIGGCSSPASQVALAGYTAACGASNPVISFDIGLDSYLFTDTGQILNTGGWDFVNNGYYGEDGNESINWNLVGGEVGVRGGTGVPEPLTLALFGAGLAGAAAMRRRTKKIA